MGCQEVSTPSGASRPLWVNYFSSITSFVPLSFIWRLDHIYTDTRTHSYSHTYKHTHSHTHRHSHTYTHTYEDTRTYCTHTHKHTLMEAFENGFFVPDIRKIHFHTKCHSILSIYNSIPIYRAVKIKTKSSGMSQVPGIIWPVKTRV